MSAECPTLSQTCKLLCSQSCWITWHFIQPWFLFILKVLRPMSFPCCVSSYLPSQNSSFLKLYFLHTLTNPGCKTYTILTFFRYYILLRQNSQPVQWTDKYLYLMNFDKYVAVNLVFWPRHKTFQQCRKFFWACSRGNWTCRERYILIYLVKVCPCLFTDINGEYFVDFWQSCYVSQTGIMALVLRHLSAERGHMALCPDWINTYKFIEIGTFNFSGLFQ